MLGLQLWHALLQNAANGIERAKDYNSISGLRRSNGRLQRLQRAGEKIGRNIFSSGCFLPLKQQILTTSSTLSRQIGKVPAVY